ncbi:MAG TPA: carboxypeptidase-like regulatory domain-containing protein [Polyangiales bacterium]|nr:carboxypeptidase-like regulatory domain-containing protein [Polyangiales bacterium]
MRIHATLIAVLIACFLGTSAAHAQAPSDTREGIASTGLCGLASEAYPTCPERWAVAANAGYGYTESVGNVAGAHHRLMGSLGAGVVPLPWLAVALRFDGRIDLHPHDDRGKDVTGTGDPRLFLRGGYDLKRGASVGGEVVVWAPGNTAPSFEPKAITADFKALAAWRPSEPFALLGHVGYRLDNSAESAPDLRRLRQGDRLALGLSDFDAVLIGVGGSLRMIEKTELFAELGLDMLLGSGAPDLKVSPLRATLGARYFLPKNLQGEAALTAVFSSRPSFATDAPLVPVEPRVTFTLGVRYGRPLHPPPAAAPEQPTEQPTALTQPEQPKTFDVRGRIIDDKQEPVPDVRVVLTVAPETTLREAVTDGEGVYSFSQVPVGDATLEATAPGFQTQQWVLEVRPDMAPAVERSLVRKSDTGTLRLLTRTFSSEPLAATIAVRDTRGRKAGAGKSDANGSYEIDLPPGRYTVMISAPGYRTLRRDVQIERYGVAILNVDMREEK